jgi:hypothetical protein
MFEQHASGERVIVEALKVRPGQDVAAIEDETARAFGLTFGDDLVAAVEVAETQCESALFGTLASSVGGGGPARAVFLFHGLALKSSTNAARSATATRRDRPTVSDRSWPL